MSNEEFQGAFLRELGLLRQDLRRVEEKVDRIEGKVDACYKALEHLSEAQLETYKRGDRHGRRLRRIERQMALVSSAPPMTDVPDWRPEASEVTGTYELKVLREAAAERMSDAKHLRRKKVEWAVGGAGALVLFVLGAVVAIITRR